MPPKPQAHRGDLNAGGIRTPGDFAALSAGGEWDAGELGCGHLLIELRKILREMPGEVLKVISRDPGSPEDLPAWCRLSGNELLAYDAQGSCYWIRSKTDWT